MNTSEAQMVAKAETASDGSAEAYCCSCCGKSQHIPNAVTVAALKEGRDIRNGKKKTKSYHSADEFLADLKA